MSNKRKRSKAVVKKADPFNKAANSGRISLRVPAKFHETVETWLNLAEESRPLREMIIHSDDDRSEHNGQGKDSTKINKSMVIKWLAIVGQYRTLYDYDRERAEELLTSISDHQRSEYRREMIRILDHFNPNIIRLIQANPTEPTEYPVLLTMLDGYLRDHFLFAPADPCFDLRYSNACVYLQVAAQYTPHPDDDI